MMAFALLTFFIGPLSGALSDRIGYRGLGMAGMLIHAAGLVLLSRLGTTADNLDVAWRLSVCGFGAGMFQSPINSAVMGSAPIQFRGIASSLLAVIPQMAHSRNRRYAATSDRPGRLRRRRAAGRTRRSNHGTYHPGLGQSRDDGHAHSFSCHAVFAPMVECWWRQEGTKQPPLCTS